MQSKGGHHAPAAQMASKLVLPEVGKAGETALRWPIQREECVHEAATDVATIHSHCGL